jgi:outer membrane protein OmpA-like peptidoglycan-associated protein
MSALASSALAAALLVVAARASACDGWEVDFRTGSARLTLKDVRGLSRLVALNHRLEEGGAPSLYHVTGYSDASGSRQHNVALSKRRADDVRAALVRLGVSPRVITVRGAGASIAPRAPSGDWKSPRRFVIIAFGRPGFMCGE